MFLQLLLGYKQTGHVVISGKSISDDQDAKSILV